MDAVEFMNERARMCECYFSESRETELCTNRSGQKCPVIGFCFPDNPEDIETLVERVELWSLANPKGMTRLEKFKKLFGMNFVPKSTADWWNEPFAEADSCQEVDACR